MPPRRSRKIAHPKQPDADEDLRELAAVLDEHRLDQNAGGWFSIPWKDGWYAVQLACACFEQNFDGEWESPKEEEIKTWLTNVCRQAMCAEDYWQAGELLRNTAHEGVSLFLFAALRCLQVLISNSSGGGEVYNYLLKQAFDKTEPAQLFEDVVLEYRCRDAIGVSACMNSDKDDRKRRAFSIAWKRGLFHAAYSIEPAKGQRS